MIRLNAKFIPPSINTRQKVTCIRLSPCYQHEFRCTCFSLNEMNLLDETVRKAVDLKKIYECMLT